MCLHFVISVSSIYALILRIYSSHQIFIHCWVCSQCAMLSMLVGKETGYLTLLFFWLYKLQYEYCSSLSRTVA
jgi:hypothetical protein